MLNISWGQFLAILAALLIIYYTIVAIFFYRKETINLFRKKSATGGNEGNIEKVSKQEERINDGTIDLLEAVVADLHGILVKAGKEAGRRELLRQLSERLANYAGFRHPAFRAAIINYVVKNADSLCGESFSADELEQQWQDLPR